MSGGLANDPLVGFWLGRLLLAMATAIVLSVTFLLVHHAASLRREEWRRRRIAAAAEELAPYLAGRAGAAAAVARAVRSRGRFAVSTVLRRARRSLAGDGEQALSALLEEMGETRRLARAARRGGAVRRCRALRSLASCGGARARRELLRASADRRPEIRRSAHEGLLELRDPFSARAALAAFVGETDLPASWRRSFLLRLAVYAPGELRSLVAARALPPGLEKLALEALAETGDAAAAPLALNGVRSASPEMRAAGVRLLGAIGDGRWASVLARLLHDPEWYVRAAAARALGGLGPDSATVGMLAVVLTDAHWWVRSNAARSLARLGPAGLNRLARAATASYGDARQAAMPELLRRADAPAGAAPDDATTRDLAVAS